jgi:dihydrodipicolinate synthase/N-acetylneuraminate lyase
MTNSRSYHRPGGIICPLALPLTKSGALDILGQHQLIDRILRDVDAIFLLGTTGEFAFLTDQMADEVVDEALGYIQGRVPVYVGVSGPGTAQALENLQRADREGVEYVVATSPYYYPIHNQERLIEHFTTIADAAPCPLIIYNIPQNTTVNLTFDSVQRLSKHPNIAGIKDSWGDMVQFQEFAQLSCEDFSVMQGREQLAAVSFWVGGDGLVSALTNIAPRMLRRIYQAVQANEHQEALQAQREVTRLAQVFDQGYWVSGLKATLFELGIGSGEVTQPFSTCTPDQVDTIRKRLIEADLLPKEEGKHG